MTGGSKDPQLEAEADAQGDRGDAEQGAEAGGGEAAAQRGDRQLGADPQGELVLDMPQLARDETMLWQLRVNWLAHGHGPTPYGEAHFDLHFYRGTTAEIDAIDCSDQEAFAPGLLTPDHELPTTCVSRMGYHAWPTADSAPGAVFTASLILGYYAQKMVFIEPMIARSTLLSHSDFELVISRPTTTGGPPTLYPTRMRGLWVADEAAYYFEFDEFVVAQ